MRAVGREAELAAVESFLERVSHGPLALVLAGAAGIGKSTVWREGVAAASERGLAVLECRAAQAESGLGFGGLIDLFTPVAGLAVSALPPPQRSALAVALLLEEAPAGRAPQQREVSVAVLGALRTLAARGPVVLAVDDVQWLDAASARVLAYALRRLREEPVGVLATYRVGEAEPPALSGLDFEQVELAGLTVGALHRVVRNRLGVSLARPELTRLERATGGNPFFALEIVRQLERRGHAAGALPVPAPLRQLVAERLFSLAPATREAVLATYALAHPTDELVEEALRLGRRSARGLAHALASGVLVRRGDAVELEHPLLGSVLYEELAPAERRRLHERLARLPLDPEERSRHLAAAATQPDDGVAATLEEAAAGARRRGATDAAVELLQLALDLTPPELADEQRRRAIALAQDEYVSGHVESSLERLQRVAAEAPPGPVRARAVWLATMLTGVRAEGADGRLEQALAEAGDDASLRSGIAMTLARSAWWGSAISQASAHAAAAVAFAEEADDRAALAPALAQAAIVDFYLGRPWEENLERAIALEQELEGALPVEVMPSLFRGTIFVTLCEDPDESVAAVLELRERASARGDGPGFAATSIALCQLETKLGRYARAAEHVREGREAAARFEALHLLDSFDYLEALVAAHEGRADEARRVATRVVDAAAAAGTHQVENQARQVLGFLELSAGRPEAAADWLLDLIGRYRAMEYVEPNGLRFVPDLVEALVQLGRLEEADAILRPYEETAVRLDRPWARAVAARCRGVLQAAAGDGEAAAATLEEAVRRSEAHPQPLELGRARLAQGVVARRGKRKRIADEALARAEDVFAGLGAGLWLERARAERARVGLRPRAPSSLTETEERVARLAAAGKRNGEIAAELFMSVRAVEGNLTRVYRKLGVRSRSELGARVGAL